MKYNVEILPAAWEDLKKIEDWYLINFDVETAIKVSDHILDGIERLGDFPDSGSRAPDDWLNEQGYRMVISGKHVSNLQSNQGHRIYLPHFRYKN